MTVDRIHFSALWILGVALTAAAGSAQVLSLSHRQVSDIDGDGHVDIADATGVWLGDGAGAFPTQALAVSAAQWPGLGDLNDDGATDVVYPGEVHLGDGNGGFLAPIAFPLSQPSAGATRPLRTDLHVADLDGDGHEDVIAGLTYLVSPTAGFSLFSVYSGDGTGNLSAPTETFLNQFIEGLRVADMNADGALDLVLAFSPANTEIWTNDGTGGWLVTRTFSHGGLWSADHEIADVDDNGLVDLVILSVSFFFPDTEILTHLQVSPGQFMQAPSSVVGYTTAFRMRLGDYDGDGIDDALLNQDRTNVQILKGVGDGTFRAPFQLAAPSIAALNDVDADGDLDIVTARRTVDFNQLPQPAGIASFGTGTAGCDGAHGVSATSAPTVGNADFALTVTNAPMRSEVGVCWFTDAADTNGRLVFDFLLHIDLGATTFIATHPIRFDTTPAAFVPLPIPPSAIGLVGSTLYAQMAWVLPEGSRCRPSLLGVSTSPGLAITIQP